MAVDRLSSHLKNRVKYRIRSAFRSRQGRGGKARLGVAAVTGALHARGWVSKTVTFHAIVGKPLAELIDHDEEDAQGVTEATLTKQQQSRVKICSSLAHFHK